MNIRLIKQSKINQDNLQLFLYIYLLKSCDIQTNAEKAFDQIKHLFLIKTLSKIRIEGNFLNLIKDIHETTTAIIILNFERLDVFLLRTGPRQRYSPSSLLFNTALDILALQVHPCCSKWQDFLLFKAQ